jgi:hypothetical protein
VRNEDNKDAFMSRNDPANRPQKDSKSAEAMPWDMAFSLLKDSFNDENWKPQNPFITNVSVQSLEPSDLGCLPADADTLAKKWREFRSVWEPTMANFERSGQNKSIEDFTNRKDVIFFYHLLLQPGNEELLNTVKSPIAAEEAMNGNSKTALMRTKYKSKKRSRSSFGGNSVGSTRSMDLTGNDFDNDTKNNDARNKSMGGGGGGDGSGGRQQQDDNAMSNMYEAIARKENALAEVAELDAKTAKLTNAEKLLEKVDRIKKRYDQITDKTSLLALRYKQLLTELDRQIDQTLGVGPA